MYIESNEAAVNNSSKRFMEQMRDMSREHDRKWFEVQAELSKRQKAQSEILKQTFIIPEQNNNTMEQLLKLCIKNELTVTIDPITNKITIGEYTFTSDSIEKSIEMALCFIK